MHQTHRLDKLAVFLRDIIAGGKPGDGEVLDKDVWGAVNWRETHKPFCVWVSMSQGTSEAETRTR